METPGFGILMILATVALAFGIGVAVIARLLRGQTPSVGRLAVLAGAWAVLYLAALLAVSLGSREQVLGWGADKKFCGFYLDCHAQIAVTGVEVLDTLGGVRADGRFHVVTLRIGSDARAVAMRLHNPRLTVTDETGGRYPRSARGEAALAATRGPLPALTDEVGPGRSYTAAVVFDLPPDACDPRLAVTEGWWADRLVEFLLIGDEDSFLHARTSFRLAT